jgi:hypothetical protein
MAATFRAFVNYAFIAWKWHCVNGNNALSADRSGFANGIFQFACLGNSLHRSQIAGFLA